MTVMSPFPGRRNMRAIAVLRRPVPRYCSIFDAHSLITFPYYLDMPFASPQFYATAHRHGLLGLHAGACRPRKPSTSGTSACRAWSWGACRKWRLRPSGWAASARTRRDAHFHQSAGIAGEMAVKLLLVLSSGQPDLVGVDHDHVIARIEERRVAGLVLAHQNHGGFAGELAENLVFGVHHVPGPGDCRSSKETQYSLNTRLHLICANQLRLPDFSRSCQILAGGRWPAPTHVPTSKASSIIVLCCSMQVSRKRKTGIFVPVIALRINNLRGENGYFGTRLPAPPKNG